MVLCADWLIDYQSADHGAAAADERRGQWRGRTAAGAIGADGRYLCACPKPELFQICRDEHNEKGEMFLIWFFSSLSVVFL
jgi:hypothetical protein